MGAMTVWMDSWQMECCGTPFRIGDRVDWAVREPDRTWLADVLGPQAAGEVDAAEGHHGDVDPATGHRATGRVVGIRYAHCRYAPAHDGTRHAVPGSGTLTPVSEAEQWVEDLGEARFVGYLVQVEPE
ncbi:hypothetical protein H9Y04_08650 [Streptomyces sp. TRM66268-LWL]|uniref:Uncharacterized protein n=1 Tax=Streptomyces polyasparticus TaxID=2767826 RepID=A0ABR7SAY2_9ACTN|nr:DUF6578 domain-containing protein [Streptomyces polyasparticus]MBC9712642.1 hypothetical protein [Streptomyces polyasparticus]